MATKPLRPHSEAHPHGPDVVNRLARVSGHLGAVKTMVEEGQDCAAVLQQVSAVIAALKKVRLLILEDHLDHCLSDHIETENGKALMAQMKEALRRF
jgi:DNA-binding FrmR family transcriptional regulator